jgi:TonB family protein
MELLIHLGKSSLLLILFYGCYWLILRQTTFFHLNRAYLLVAMVLSLLLPFIYTEIEVTVKLPEQVSDQLFIASDHITLTDPATTLSGEASPIFADFWVEPLAYLERLLIYGYLTGILVALALFLRTLFRLSKLTRLYSTSDLPGVAVATHPELREVGSFSFLGTIYLSENDYLYHFDEVYFHEKIHASQMHSLDVLFTQFLQILFWFNPILRMYKSSLQEVHEYLADCSARDRESYAQFLVSYTLYPGHEFRMVNSFSHPQLLKSRITMLYKKRDSRLALYRYLVIVPIILLTVMLTATRRYTYRTPNAQPQVSTPINSADLPAPEVSPEAIRPVLVESDTTIKGRVTDGSTQTPLPGATILVKGTSKGTTTDSAGTFAIDLPAGHRDLVVSFVGFVSQTLEIDNEKTISIALNRKKQPLKEVVVIGYGSVKATTSQAGDKPNPSTVFTAVEQMPEFQGGVSEMYKYLARNIRYPGEAARANIQGEVHLSFVINKTGHIRSPKVTKGVGYGLDEEALRVVISMPPWKPGRQNGEPVDVEYTLPIHFRIDQPEKPDRQGSNSPVGHPIKESTTGSSLANAAGDSANTGPHLSSTAELNYLRDAPRQGFNSETRPLFLLDGKELSDKSVERIDPSTIASIEVRKDVETTSQYGEKAKYGVISITTKKLEQKN